MRSPETDNLSKKLPFYLDVIEASDYLRMLDIMKIIDSKICLHFSFGDLCKEFDRIFPFPLSKTKTKVQTGFIDCVNLRNYTDLSLLSPAILMRIFETDNFTINENPLWEFLSSFIGNFETETGLIQQLIDSIRPGLLDECHLERFYQFLNEHRLSWTGKTVSDLRAILSMEDLRQMNFCRQSQSNLLTKARSIPYLIVSSTAVHNSLRLSKFSLSNLEIETDLSIAVDSDSYRCQSFGSHLVFVNNDWDLNRNLGIFLNLTNYRHSPISHWPHRLDNDIDVADDFHKFWGFSFALFDSDLFLFGGCYFTHDRRTVPSNNVARFNFIDSQWKIVADVHLKVACWSSSAVRDCRNSAAFFISGGRSPRRYLKSFYLVDIDSSSVIDYPSLPFTMHGHTMAMSGNVVAVHGGVWDGNVRHDVLLFELDVSVWRVVSLTRVPDMVHIDYCCDTAGDNDGRRIAFYELTKCDRNTAGVYLHRVDIGEGIDGGGGQSVQLVANMPCAQPRNIMCVLSLKLSKSEVIIGEEVFNGLID